MTLQIINQNKLHSLLFPLILNYDKSEKWSFPLLSFSLVTKKAHKIKHSVTFLDFSYGSHLGGHSHSHQDGRINKNKYKV